MSGPTFAVYSHKPPMPDDVLQQLAAVFCRAFGRHDRQAVETMIDEEAFLGHRYIIASVDGEFAGFVSWRRWGEDRHRLAELFHIGIDLQNQQARGLGRLLIAQMEEDVHAAYQRVSLPGARQIFILTHADNSRAHNLYRRCGYEHRATLPNFFHPRIDEVNTGDEFFFAKDFRSGVEYHPEQRLDHRPAR